MEPKKRGGTTERTHAHTCKRTHAREKALTDERMGLTHAHEPRGRQKKSLLTILGLRMKGLVSSAFFCAPNDLIAIDSFIQASAAFWILDFFHTDFRVK